MAGQPDPELTARLRALPAVHLLVNAPSARELEAAHGHLAVTEAARAAGFERLVFEDDGRIWRTEAVGAAR